MPTDAAQFSSTTAHDPGRRERVWDLGIRLFHWALVAAVAIALVTGFLAPRQWQDVHVIAGTVIAILIVYRIVWGFLGSTHARFANFVVAPSTALRHARDLLHGSAHRHVGHNPVGSMMILVLLATLIGLTLTGAIVLGGIAKEGPLAPFTTFATGRGTREIHELLAFGLIGLIGLHVAGIVIEGVRTRENLVRSMIIGDKRIEAGSDSAVDARPRRLLAAIVFAGITIAAGGAIAHWSMLPARGVPTAALDPAYVKECGACHTPHHPSLAPAATWTSIMANLADHFGDNAEMNTAQTKSLLEYLRANSAEAFDSNAANRLRINDAGGSMRITDTAGWKRLHRKVAADAFKAKKVAGKLNCAACHGDAASGRFAPRSISIPKE